MNLDKWSNKKRRPRDAGGGGVGVGHRAAGRAPYSPVNQSEERAGTPGGAAALGEKRPPLAPPDPEGAAPAAGAGWSPAGGEAFPPEPGCDLSNPYYDLAVPSSSSSSYTVDSHWELLKVTRQGGGEGEGAGRGARGRGGGEEMGRAGGAGEVGQWRSEEQGGRSGG